MIDTGLSNLHFFRKEDTMKRMVLGILVLLFLSALAMADHVSISASAFTAHSSGEGYSRDSYGRYISKTISSGFLHAPVFLPDGCIIKNIRLNCIDNSDTGYVSAYLFRTNHFNGTYTLLFSASSSGAASSPDMQWFVDSTCSPASYRQVRNGSLTWHLCLAFTEADTDIKAYSVQIEYYF
jgi:hypothetical protein